MAIQVDKIEAPEYWASYLVNGDASGMDASDKAECDKWIAGIGDGWSVVSTEGDESSIGRFYFPVQGRLLQTSLITYVLHRCIEPEVTPVLFRVDNEGGHKTVTAVFPCDPDGRDGLMMSCYSHIGQHSACSFGWLHMTRRATPAEYADLKAELEASPYRYRLKVYSRMQRWMHERRAAELRSINDKAGKMESSR